MYFTRVETKINLLSYLSLFLLAPAVISTTLCAEDTEEETESPDLFSSTLESGEVFSCSADIFYHWKSDHTQTEDNTGDDDTTDESGNTVHEQKEFFTTLVERGRKGLQARQLLERRLDKSKSEALRSCRENHSAATCESKQLQALTSKFQILDFEGKRALRKSITESCGESSGTCIKSSSSEITCEIFSSPDTPLKAEPKKAEETKGKK